VVSPGDGVARRLGVIVDDTAELLRVTELGWLG
jgi:hypothetical protein